MERIISIVNLKGGVGKTTSTLNIGAELAKQGKRVLLIDLDAQTNLTQTLIGERATEIIELTIYDAIVGNIDYLPILDVRERLNLIPASIELIRADIDLAKTDGKEYLLRTLLEPIKANYDYILIDNAPSLGIITTNALNASTDVIIPLAAEGLPYKGLKMLLDVINTQVQQRTNKDLNVFGIFLTRYNNRSLNKFVENRIVSEYKDLLLDTRIRENIAVAEAPLTQKTIYEYEPKSHGASDYLDLTLEILNKMERLGK